MQSFKSWIASKTTTSRKDCKRSEMLLLMKCPTKQAKTETEIRLERKRNRRERKK